MPGCEQVDGKRNARMPRTTDSGDLGDRIGEDLRLGQPRIRQLMHEAGVRTILQQTADQIGQQIAMPADRRVNAALMAMLAHQPLVQAIAHAVKPLELEVVGIARPFQNGRDGQRIVAGKGGADILGRQHVLGDRQIGHVGRRLAGEQRIVVEAFDLSALDLAIPVCALDQADVHDPVEAVGPGDDRAGALAIGLHRYG